MRRFIRGWCGFVLSITPISTPALASTAAVAFIGVGTLTACSGGVQAPKTPNQALVEAYGALGAAATAFNVYASQRPFCGDPGARPAPLCAKRDIVIEGDKMATQVADGLAQAEQVIKAVGAADVQWKALADPLKGLAAFQAFVTKAQGG